MTEPERVFIFRVPWVDDKKPAREYVKLGQPVDFYTILESAAQKNEVAMGYRVLADAKDPEKGYGVVVNPKKSDRLELVDEDMIIVLSED